MKKFLLFFGMCLFALNLWAVSNSHNVLEYFTKPLLMPCIALYFWLAVPRTTAENPAPMYLAFFFSWLGDVFLLFAGKDFVYFLAGIGGFLVAQLAYVRTFWRHIPKAVRRFRPAALLFVGYAAAFYALLFPSLDAILAPAVLLYATALTAMGLSAFYRQTSRESYSWVLLGACLFILSDSLIAYNKFVVPFALAPFFIMLTYLVAQWLIMWGMLRHLHR